METASSPAVLLLDLPQAALAGIDLLSFTVTPRFRGVKSLPPGWHVVFTGSSTAFSVRHGIWFHIESGETPNQQLFITRWDAASECLSIDTNETEHLRWHANIGEFWREGLTPYRQTSSKDPSQETQEESSDWPQLTAYISSHLLTRITAGDEDHWHLTSASSAPRDLDDIPGLSALHPEKPLTFLPINLKQTWRSGATGRERTEAAQDRSWALQDLLQNHCDNDPMDVVGELQFCFLMVLTLNNWSCFEQWKRLLTLLFTCKTVIPSQPDLFIRALATLRLQLSHCKDAEGGLIDLADEGGSLLQTLLARFRRNLETFPPGVVDVQDVLDELDDLEGFLAGEFGWEFGGRFNRSGVLELEDGEVVGMETTVWDEEEEMGEFGPQVVELTGEMRRELGLVDLEGEDVGERLGRVGLGDDPGFRNERGTGGVAAEALGLKQTISDDEESEEEEMDDLEDMDARY